jgi:molybdopterin converting factor small subunit
MMTLRIKYFVPFDQLMGKSEILQAEKGAKVMDILALLSKKYREFGVSNLCDNLVILVNGKIYKQEWPMEDGDQISILTPLMGG